MGEREEKNRDNLDQIRILLEMNSEPSDDVFYAAVVSKIRVCFSEASEVSDVNSLYREIMAVVSSWAAEVIDLNLDVLCRKPTVSALLLYESIFPDLLRFGETVFDGAMEASAAEKTDIQKASINAKLENNKRRREREMDAVRRIYEDARLRMKENGRGDAESVEIAAQEARNAYEVAERMTDRILSETMTDEERLSSRKLQAEILYSLLMERIYPEEKEASLCYKGREEKLEKLKKLYAGIRTLDDRFAVPPLPAVRTVGDSEKREGCYIATAVYGSYDCPQVWTLRRFRDQVLRRTAYGRCFIRIYYRVSPLLVRRFGASAGFRRLWKTGLDRLVQRLNRKGISDAPYEDGFH